ncbi:dipeptide/oligopeptide/nickel ABC transporter permease/ATP-binding protein [Myceligenerans xiligouense]|uniref:ABC-type dipeptide/oligopeptide/nickel transport system ATPase component n=1 Tax=Myceligenerans xiligouense TaxID=253184 RepID=A0A3N4ZNY3_9MICO|nr:dipeptide/oligopeptide/nickel ABC transporter permease/ATP-binding protein [Myceligenerans xiligouense]RPF22655.1 ABC-type dipeptide/oligopeptide/nickel transport system ATPase component [Myceligenerans xiligouense]
MTGHSAPVTAPARVSLLRRLLRRPLGLSSLLFLALVLVVAVIGPWIAPFDPNRAAMDLILAPPGAEHLLGTDNSGRDVLSRLLAATQISVAAAALATVVALSVGVIAGLIAGYYRGWFDGVASWVTSLVMALPGLVVLLAARAVLGPSVWIAMLIFGLLLAPAYYRLVHAAVSAVRGELYVDAARVSGLGDARIIGRHVLAAVRAPIIIQSAIVAGIAIAIQSGLEFLGLGDLRVPTWGSMLNDGFLSIYRMPLLMVWPSLAIALTCIALTILANSMRDELEMVAVRRRRRKLPKPVESTILVDSPEGREPERLVPEDAVIRHADDDHSGTGEAEPLLSVAGLRVGYEQPDGTTAEVVHGVSFDVRRGEVHGLIGESGSGKTQTAFAVLGLLPRGGRVTGGTVTYAGTSLEGGDERSYRGIRGHRIGYIPQEPMSNLDPSFTVGSQLVEPMRVVLGMSRKDATEKALALLERVGIADPRRTFEAFPFEISGGMAQRVLIAGAVSTDPELIVADEPTTALDVTVQSEVLDLLRDLQQERDMAMLLVTHNFGVVADLCNRVTVMREGLFVESGPVRTILQRPQHPYTQMLLSAVLDGGPPRPALGANIGTAP